MLPYIAAERPRQLIFLVGILDWEDSPGCPKGAFLICPALIVRCGLRGTIAHHTVWIIKSKFFGESTNRPWSVWKPPPSSLSRPSILNGSVRALEIGSE